MILVDVKLKGGEELVKQLEALPPKVSRRIERQSLKNAAAYMYRIILRETPIKTAQMWRALCVRPFPRNRRGRIAFGVFFDTQRFPGLITTSKAGVRYFYPAAVEFGRRVIRRGSAVATSGSERRRLEGWSRRADFNKTLFLAKRASEVAAGKRIPPNPFMRRAFDSSEGPAADLFIADVDADSAAAV